MSSPLRKIARAAAGHEIAQRVENAAELLRHTQSVLAVAIEKLGGELEVTDEQLEDIGTAGAQLLVERTELEPTTTTFRVRRVVSA